MPQITWMPEPEEHDYPAAASYLSLIAAPGQVEAIVARLREAPAVLLKAKDILRASGLALLPADDPHVAADLKKLKNDKALSPILLVRGSLTGGTHLQVADGYHRVCAVYHVDETTDIPCRLVDGAM